MGDDTDSKKWWPRRKQRMMMVKSNPRHAICVDAGRTRPRDFHVRLAQRALDAWKGRTSLQCRYSSYSSYSGDSSTSTNLNKTQKLCELDGSSTDAISSHQILHQRRATPRRHCGVIPTSQHFKSGPEVHSVLGRSGSIPPVALDA